MHLPSCCARESSQVRSHAYDCVRVALSAYITALLVPGEYDYHHLYTHMEHVLKLELSSHGRVKSSISSATSIISPTDLSLSFAEHSNHW